MLEGRSKALRPFVSYAQNGEDFVLWRMLHDVEDGTYIDIGACEPDTDSVTRAFYERGWSGINVDPVHAYWQQLCRARPRDVNLNIAIGDREGERDFYSVGKTGLSTLDSTIAQRHRDAGFEVVPMRITVRRLSAIWDEFVRGDVHFLKIDVEGMEAEVLAGADLARQRPWVIVIEATAPLTRQSTHADWEPALVRAGYRFVHADLVNRYYLSAERAALAERLHRPSATGEVVRAADVEARRDDLPVERRFDPARMSFLGHGQTTPTLREPTSQLCTESQLREPIFGDWCEALAQPLRLQRKLWEWAYILQVLAVHGVLAPGTKGLGFGCGREPLAAVMASRGCEVVATDLDAAAAAGQGWMESGQHARRLEDLNEVGLCEPELFRRQVAFRVADMNRISPDLRGFDFLWSSCAFEHLGSIRHGTEFVVNAMQCLKPGGLAVHTTEFNLSSNYTTIQAHDLVIFRRYDIEELIANLSRAGHVVAPLNLNAGTGPVDRYVDLPPYQSEPHLRLKLDRYVITSLGLVIRKRG